MNTAAPLRLRDGPKMIFDLQRRTAAEFLGTALLVATVVGSGVMAETLTRDVALQLLCNTLPTGAILVVLITILGPISGAHFNPAVSLVFAMRGELRRREAALYLMAQVAGGIAGAIIAHLMFGMSVVELSAKLRTGSSQWLSEVVAAFGLILVILNGIRFQQDAVPSLVGLYITAAYWFTASTSFANPAVAIAPLPTASQAYGLSTCRHSSRQNSSARSGSDTAFLAVRTTSGGDAAAESRGPLVTASWKRSPEIPGLPNVHPTAFEKPEETRLVAPSFGHRARILLLYGSVRERSYSRLLTFEAARLLESFGAETRIFDPHGLPFPDGAPFEHPKVKELRDLSTWAEGHVWCSPERHGAMSGIMKAQIDWIPLSLGAVRPTQGKSGAYAGERRVAVLQRGQPAAHTRPLDASSDAKSVFCSEGL